MADTKEEIISFKKNYLEQNKELYESMKRRANYRKLLRDRSIFPPELLYVEAREIIDSINDGTIKMDIETALELAIVSLDAIREDKIKEDVTLRRRKK